jgi:hypothetical protein
MVTYLNPIYRMIINTGNMKVLMLWSIFFSIVSGVNAQQASPGNTGTVQLTVDLSKPSPQQIPNVFSDLNFWDFRHDWLAKAADKPADYFATQFPFVKQIQFMTATGGNKDRDLFKDPENRAVLNDYDFAPLVAALRNVVKQGLKPMIKTGSVPMKYAAQPKIGFFGVNVRPPFDYEVYYQYIKALADTLVQEFGITAVRSWSWGVLTEYENKDWFAAEGDDPAATRVAYCKLYDYTVAALQDVIGAKYLTVGAHSMTTIDGLWDELDFIDHVASGTNYRTGKKGTQINFLCSSFYEMTPGVAIKDAFTLAGVLNRLRERAEKQGLRGLKYGIDEGRILNGPPEDNRDLMSRVVGFSFQGASDARMFKTMTDIHANWFAGWGLTTSGIWEGIIPVGTHVAGLGYKLAGSQRLGITISGAPADTANEVDGLAGYDKSSGTVRCMVYNYNPHLMVTTAENAVVTIRGIRPANGKTVQVKKWVVDDTHGNFWPTWWKDMAQQGITKDAFSWSMYSLDNPANMRLKSAQDYWQSKEAGYQPLAKLESVIQTMDVKQQTLVLESRLEHHAVVLYEITQIK